jgi:glucose/arabinose dehydrogenase
VLLCAAALSACGAQHVAGQRSTGPSSATKAAAKFASVTVSVPAGNASGALSTPHRLRLPSGWRAEAWARVPGARWEQWTPEHDLLVSASATGDVMELAPGKTPEAPPTQRTLISGLTDPQGMAFDNLDGHEVLYVAESDQLDRYVWNSNGTVGARKILVSGLLNPKNAGDHAAKTVVVAPDHTVYMTGGSASNASAVDLHQHPERAVIYTVNPQTDALSVFARGVRNGEGLAFAPDGTLWAAINERDNVPYPFRHAYGGHSDAYGKVIQAYVDNHPTDELARLTPGRNLGWPYCDPDPDDNPGQQNTAFHYANLSFVDDTQANPGGKEFDCAKLAPLNRGIPAHSAPLGLTFLEGSDMAAQWQGGAVLAVHGSWDRSPQRSPALLWFPWQSGSRELGAPVTIATGFQTSAAGARWGRPVDAVSGPGGDLYVSDDSSGTIYRIGPTA